MKKSFYFHFTERHNNAGMGGSAAFASSYTCTLSPIPVTLLCGSPFHDIWTGRYFRERKFQSFCLWESMMDLLWTSELDVIKQYIGSLCSLVTMTYICFTTICMLSTLNTFEI